MTNSTATPNDTLDLDIWDAAAAAAEAYVGITAAANRDLWAATHAPLSADEAATLIPLARSAEWSSAREEARERLTGAFMGIAKRVVATHYRASLQDDIRQSAAEGVWVGINAYDPAKHRSPVATIERSVLSALDVVHATRFGMRVPEPLRVAYVRARFEAAKRVQDDPATRDLDVSELAAEIAPEFGLTTDEYWRIYRVTQMLGVDGSDNVNGAAHGEFAHSPEVDHVSRYSAQTATLWDATTPNVAHDAQVADFLGGLTDREREVVALRFGLDDKAAHTEDEAADVLGVTPRRVRQIQAAALAKLRATASVAE